MSSSSALFILSELGNFASFTPFSCSSNYYYSLYLYFWALALNLTTIMRTFSYPKFFYGLNCPYSTIFLNCWDLAKFLQILWECCWAHSLNFFVLMAFLVLNGLMVYPEGLFEAFPSRYLWAHLSSFHWSGCICLMLFSGFLLQYLNKQKLTLCIKSVSECHHFVEDTSQTPYVWLLIVFSVFPNFRRHHVRSTDFCFGHIESFIHDLRNSEITDFHLVLRGNKNIFTF